MEFNKAQLVEAWSTGNPLKYKGVDYRVLFRAPNPVDIILEPISQPDNESSPLTGEEIWLERSSKDTFKPMAQLI